MSHQQKHLKEIFLIEKTLGLAARSIPPQDEIHANNIQLLISRYEIMLTETQARAVKSMQNVLGQIRDPELHAKMHMAIQEKISGWS